MPKDIKQIRQEVKQDQSDLFSVIRLLVSNQAEAVQAYNTVINGGGYQQLREQGLSSTEATRVAAVAAMLPTTRQVRLSHKELGKKAVDSVPSAFNSLVRALRQLDRFKPKQSSEIAKSCLLYILDTAPDWVVDIVAAMLLSEVNPSQVYKPDPPLAE